MFKKFFDNFSKYKILIKAIESGRDIHLTGLTGTARSFFVSRLIKNTRKPALIVTPDIATALKYTTDVKNFTDKSVSFLPSQEASPYEQVYSDPEITREQLGILREHPQVIVTPVKNLLNTYLSRENIKKYSIKLVEKAKADPYDIAEKLVEIGYKRTTTVIDPGEFSLRGDILDIYPISAEPVRIEFFCDEVEKLREFSIDTQRSIRKLTGVIIEPRYRVVIPKESKEELLNKLILLNDKTPSPFLENFIARFEADTYTEGIEYFAPLIDGNFTTMFDYLPKDTVVFLHESHEIAQRAHIQDDKYTAEYNKNVHEGLCAPLPSPLHLKAEEALERLNKFPSVKLDTFIGEDAEITEEVIAQSPPKFSADLYKAGEYLTTLKNQGIKVFIDTKYPERLSDSLEQLGLACEIVDMGFEEGFIFPEINLAVITDVELFNKKLKKATLGKKLSKKENIDYLVSVNDLKEGDFVVHARHGIGKFLGMSKQTIDGQIKDYLTIEYANTDKLYMPAEQINMLSRYRGSGTVPKLQKMGGAEWQKIKSKVKAGIADIAEELIKLYARRAKAKGYIFEPDSAWQIEMENAFPYTETPDQMQAILDTKADMESEKILDRLICGDVGFGKTEVALRAVFKAVLSGKQVAILAPTTILAYQHYLTFVERLKPYPVKIELLSRFRTAKEQKQTLNNLQTGECDVVIGTHRLLQKDVHLKNPGLLVIDEEHRFGVTHKEKIKQLKADIDVLTLSATPIPRTLNMALSGLREMSLINTPPVNRAPIKTYVGPYNDQMVRTAILHELEREGQVYYLHNRVQSIYKVAEELQELTPSARIIVGHGQMNEKELEKVMYDFSTHEYDILVCTTIIESGLDIPNSNTIIIDDADKFGLAQLYQIRGRVGRSERQAYAYCLYNPDKVLSAEAKDRLKAIKDFTTLGSGYQIALRDLEIRGVGNILGAQQHGHMLSVGFDLYCSLLEETVQELKGEKPAKRESTIIDINITAFIPDDWVGGDKEQKMIEYKRLADVTSTRELDILKDEWTDRFGGIPVEVERLIKIIYLRLLATDLGIKLVRETGDDIRIFSDYTMAEFNLLKRKLEPKIAAKLKWAKTPMNSENGSSVMILNCSYLAKDDKPELLEMIFLALHSLQKSSAPQ